MTNILAICSALNNSYIGLNIEDKIYTKIIKSDEKNYHSLYLINEIKKLFNKTNFSVNDLDYITTNTGPGSFTGIRVSLTIAKVMASELNIPIVDLNTAEILLTAYNCDNLIMDARRDMYYVASLNKIDLIPKDKLPKLEGKILTDKRSQNIFKDSICYEDKDEDLAQIMLNLAKQKYNSSKTKEEFDYQKITANYIQTPPVCLN